MATGDYLLPAAAELKPYQQGHVSSLCGLYSLLNAIQLALWPRRLTRTQLKALFSRGIAHLDQCDLLADVLHDGMDEDVWLGLGRVLIDRASIVMKVPIRRQFIIRRRPRLTRVSAIATIKLQLRAGRPVTLILWGAYNHITVVVGYRRGKLILFDSSGFKWVAEASVGLHHPSSTKRHQITRTGVLALNARLPRQTAVDW